MQKLRAANKEEKPPVNKHDGTHTQREREKTSVRNVA